MDDIEIKRETCEIQPSQASPQLQSYGIINCGFENTYCNWENSTIDTQINWELALGWTQTINTGPSSGAFFSDFYLYIKAFEAKPGDRARLISQTLAKPSKDSYCLAFFYHMWGK